MKQRGVYSKDGRGKGGLIVFFISMLIVAVFTFTSCLCFGAFDGNKSGAAQVENTQAGGVTTSLTGGGTYSYTSSGAINNGDVITIAYYAAVYTITLPMGTYKLEAWGAQGGGNSATSYGGFGGYTYAQFEFTAASNTIYCYTGQNGRWGSNATTEAWNGGGYLTTSHNGGGGGGATHFATRSGKLSALESYKSDILIVAGGGGGMGCSCAINTCYAGAGGGGHNPGQDGPAQKHSSNRGGGYGGTTSGPGAGGATVSGGGAETGSFGKGANQTTGGSSSGGGAGGGGYYGGGSGGSDYPNHNDFDDGPGGGGSGFINFSRCINDSSKYGGTTGAWGDSTNGAFYNGKAQITAINVNRPPTTSSNVITLNAGVSGTITTTIAPSQLATDPEGSALYYTTGTSGSLDSYPSGTDNYLYTDASGNGVDTVKKYISWSWTDNQTLKITGVKMYPRSGVDCCTSNGRLTLYVKIRDNYGSTASRGWAYILFYIKIPVNTVSKRSNTTITRSTGNYIIGSSNTDTAPTDTATTSTIYNPGGTGRYTAIAQKPLKLGSVDNSFTVVASDLLTGTSLTNNVDQVLMVLNDTTNYASSVTGRIFKVNQLDLSGQTTMFNSSKSSVGNAFTQLTITALKPSTSFQSFSVTLYVVEKTTAYGSSYPNTVPDISTYAMDIVFRTVNTRPVLSTAGTVVDIGIGANAEKTINFASYMTDVDETAISTSTHSITGVIVPTNEFIMLDRDGYTITPVSPNNTYYNKGTATGTSLSTDACTSTETGFNNKIAYNATSGGTDTTREAFMRYTYSGLTITVTGLRPSFSQYKSGRGSEPGHFYLLVHLQDKRETTDNGIWLPIAFRVGYSSNFAPVNTNTTPHSLTAQGATSTLPQAIGGLTAVGDEKQDFYFAPGAINYSGSHVVGYRLDGGTLRNDDLQPLAIDGDNFATTTGVTTWGAKLNDLLRLSSATTPESIVKSVSEVGYSYDSTTGVAENNYIKVKYIDVYIPQSYIAATTYAGGRVVAAAGTEDTTGFKYAGALTTRTVSGTSYYIINGFQITLKSPTMNRYFYASAGVTDITGQTVSDINIVIRCKNRSLEAEATGGNVAGFGNPDTSEVYSTYTNGGLPTMYFRIPLNKKVVITPYDIFSDIDMKTLYGSSMTVSGGFTLNGLTARYTPSTGVLSTSQLASDDNVAFSGMFSGTTYGNSNTAYMTALRSLLSKINNTTAVKKVSTSATAGTAVGAATAANQSVMGDRLFFARTTDGTSDGYTYNPYTRGTGDIAHSTSGTSGFISYEFGNTLQLGSDTYTGLDFIIITATKRTNQPVHIDLTVRDRFGDSSDCTSSLGMRISIEVVNSAPSVKDEERYEQVAVSPVDSNGIVTLSTVQFFAADQGTEGEEGYISGLMEDMDDDTPDFIVSRGVMLANRNDLAQLLPDITSFNSVDAKYKTDDGTATGRPLTEYLSAQLVSQFVLSATALSSTKAVPSGVYIYFFVTDGHGGTTLGFVRVEVVNSMPVANTADDGFDPADPLWKIETTSNADINRPRYVVGSQDAAGLLQEKAGAIAKDIRLIATDSDALHGGVTLSPIGTDSAYVNLVLPDGADPNTFALTATLLQSAVPDVAVATAFNDDTAPAAAIAYTVANGGAPQPVLPTDYSAEFRFYYNDGWVTRTELITALTGSTLADVSDYFDNNGRWISTDWALRLRAQNGFDSGVELGVTLSMRDEAALGGDTAGCTTAYNSNRLLGRVDVVGSMTATFFQTISKTGIRTKDEYNEKYNDYYVVEYDAAAGEVYVPTYDGNKNSAYAAGDDKSDIMYKTVLGAKYLVTDGSTDASYVKINERSARTVDSSYAGTGAGVKYNAASVDSVAGAYKFPSVIEIPADHSEVYVPMSYFGLLQDLVSPDDTTGEVKYPTDFVGYDISGTYSRGSFSAVRDSISLSDGSNSWWGASLAENPYIDIDVFDDYDYVTRVGSADYFSDPNSAPYFNNRLSALTVEEDELLGYENYSANKPNFVGNGRLLYLEDQATKLQEHNFGLVFSKTKVRTGARNLTLTINLAKASSSTDGFCTNIKAEPEDARSVQISIHVQNAKLDLETGTNLTDTERLRYDDEKGTYYVDLKLATSEFRSFELVRTTEALSDSNARTRRIDFVDEDLTTVADYEETCDKAYFYNSSIQSISQWPEYSLAAQLNDDCTALTNIINSERAQRSVLNFFKAQTVYSVSDPAVVQKTAYQDLSDKLGDSTWTEEYQPNSGKYGSNSFNTGNFEGYSSYFSVSLTSRNRMLNFTASRKTVINTIALPTLPASNVAAQEVVRQFYAERGIVATYESSDTPAANPTRAYYPFRVLIYDSRGVGWTDASYVAVEFRIEITNGDPKLNTVGTPSTNPQYPGREYTLNLAVGNSVNINLYDIVSDSDMYTVGTNGNYMISTRYEFENSEDIDDIDYETGDYLLSPFANDEYLNGTKTYNPNNWYKKEDGTYGRDGGGLTPVGNIDRDVIMWMSVRGGGAISTTSQPLTNMLSFTVNRRTTARIVENGEEKNVSINEYRFSLKFYDSVGESTQYFTFIIKIANKAPVAVETSRTITMRAGDDFTVVPTYYDNFNGVLSESVAAYESSATKAKFDEHVRDYYNNGRGDGQNNETGNTRYWKYSDITSSYASAFISDSTDNASSTPIHLGYLGLADDDTPWSLRIVNCEYTSGQNAKLSVTTYFRFDPEGDASGKYSVMALRIKANYACEKEPVVVTVSDGENGFVTCTLYVTIVSSKPVARDYADENDKTALNNIGLEGEIEEEELVYGVFRLFTVPYGEGDFAVSGFDTPTKHAKKEYTIGMSNVAYDPDGSAETDYMRLYEDGNFTVNGVPLTGNTQNVYFSQYFDLQIINNGRAFKLTAKGYNPTSDRGYEELTFRIADYGNGDFANTLVITIHVYTLYSDMTNPTAAALGNSAFNEYVTGSDVVHIKAFDDYFGSAQSVDSRYAFFRVTGNTGNDGNTASPIIDPDVQTLTADKQYTVRLYAFIDLAGKALPAQTLADMFVRDASNGLFYLDRSTSTYSEYMIGGYDYNGNELVTSQVASMRRGIVNGYANFKFSDDRAALEFSPVAATLDNKNMVLYVEIEKYLDPTRAFGRTQPNMAAGSIFRLDVADSAPHPVTSYDTNLPQGANLMAVGSAGDRITFKIHDERDPFGAMFVDSDKGDVVTVSEFTDDDYEDALADSLEADPDLDWAAANGKCRAFTVSVDPDNNTLSIVINRRMDEFDGTKYKESVTFSIKIVGHDRGGLEAESVISITVVNRDIVAKTNYYNSYDPETDVGYTLSRNVDGMYVIDAQIRYSRPLEIALSDLVADPDFDSDVDVDSYMFVDSRVDVYPYSYLGDEPQDVYWINGDNQDDRRNLATVTPLGDDKWHRTGILIDAADTTRSLTARTYMRIVDRSCNVNLNEKGIYIILNISVMNDKPQVKPEMEATSIVMMGSDEVTPEGMLFFIGDFVGDENESDVTGDEESYLNPSTYLRIFSQSHGYSTKVYSTLYSSLGKDNTSNVGTAASASLFTVTIPDTIPRAMLEQYLLTHPNSTKSDYTNRYNQWFIVTPSKGFYGEGSIEITIADGDSSVKYDTLTATFRLNVNVLYNHREINNELTGVSIAASQSQNVDIGSLLPSFENKLDLYNTGEEEESTGPQTSAAEMPESFNQSDYYTLVSVDLQNESDKSYITVSRVGETSVWKVQAGNMITLDPVRVNVRYALTSDPSVTFDKYFLVNVIKNNAPTLKYSNITFVRYNKTGEKDNLRDLDDSNTIRLEPWQLLEDIDSPSSALKFVSAKSQVPSLVKVSVSSDKRYLTINFAARGESDITLDVTDETGKATQLHFKAINTDLPEGSFWLRFMANFESNKPMWIAIFCGVALALVIVIVLIAVMRRRKHAREELEALLVSEMELEETMLRLAGGPSPMGYESFGYLPPTGGPMQDPGLMLGGGASAPAEQFLGLAAGAGPESTEGVEQAPPQGDQPDSGAAE